jgi:septum formation inhibitor MinC
MYLWYSLLKAGAFLHSQTEFPEGFQADGKAPEIILGGSSSTGKSTDDGSASSRSRSVNDKKKPAKNETSEMEEFSAKIDQLNDTIILSTRLDSFNDNRHEIESDLKELYKEKNSLIEKLNKAKLDVQHEQNKPEKAILQEMVDYYKEQLDVLDKSQKEKKADLEKLKQKMNLIENKIFTVAEKTPKQSGNSSKLGASRRVVPPPSSILVSTTEDNQGVGGSKNFETPTISSSQLPGYIEEHNRKRKRTEEEQKEKDKNKQVCEESIDLLGQETETETEEDDDDDDDAELFKKIF